MTATSSSRSGSALQQRHHAADERVGRLDLADVGPEQAVGGAQLGEAVGVGQYPRPRRERLGDVRRPVRVRLSDRRFLRRGGHPAVGALDDGRTAGLGVDQAGVGGAEETGGLLLRGQFRAAQCQVGGADAQDRQRDHGQDEKLRPLKRQASRRAIRTAARQEWNQFVTAGRPPDRPPPGAALGAGGRREQGLGVAAYGLVDDRAVPEEHHAVRPGGEPRLVRDEDRGGAGVAPAAQQRENGLTCLGVEGAGRFVCEDEPPIADEGAGDGDPLLLAAGHLVGEAVGEVAEVHLLQGGERLGAGPAGGGPVQFAGRATFSAAVSAGMRL